MDLVDDEKQKSFVFDFFFFWGGEEVCGPKPPLQVFLASPLNRMIASHSMR
jgi:hypothetical protein